METIEETKTYTYDQLNPTAQEKVKAWWYEHGVEHEWWDCAYEDFKREGYELGFDIGRINFSGFYSQGDGACWSGHIDVVQWLKTHTEDSIAREAWIQLFNEGWADKHIPIGYDGRYSHSGNMSVGYWDGMIGDPASIDDLEEEHQKMQQESIFKGMHATVVLNLITSSDFKFKSMTDIAEACEQSAKEYADELYERLKTEYEYLTSEANLIEMCNINDWQFNNEGEMV
jgi:hypothetical protein